uniref:Type II toxin-antitoxin system VapC family toxin n=1 Tax=Caldiarchaeum subterraneum TaxID=311458 RepID=A0A7C5LAT6_CALS0
MMLLDTSILIKSLQKGKLIEGCISVITLVEVLRGVAAEKRNQVKTSLEKVYEIISLDNEVIMEYCDIYDALRSRGLKVPEAGLLIAASAKAKNLTLATSDKEFKKLDGLGLEIRLENG